MRRHVETRVHPVAQAIQTRRLERRLAGPKLLTAFAEAFGDAVFVEIGANDGDQHDHLRPLIDKHHWRGVMVEPVPYVFARLRRNYQHLDRIALENAALSDHDGHRAFYHLAPVPDFAAVGLPQWYDGIGSFSKEAVLDHERLIPDIADRLVTTQVQCLTFSSLCEKHGLPHVDLLVVDTEGYDHEILAGIDFARWRPALVVYEHYHLSAADRRRTRERMQAAGYGTMPEGFDTWCLRLDADDGLNRLWRALRPALGELTADDEPR
jgi:FkbM family methyltransferase